MTSIELPPLPVEPGDYRAFRDGVAAACHDYISRRPGLQPLLVPLRVTLLVVPPAQGKDLDNILLDVLPAVNEHLRPHLEPWLLDAGSGPLDEGLVDRLVGWRVKGLRRLRSLVRYSVWSAQVLELHRTPNDPEEGILAMVPPPVGSCPWLTALVTSPATGMAMSIPTTPTTDLGGSTEAASWATSGPHADAKPRESATTNDSDVVRACAGQRGFSAMTRKDAWDPGYL
jgi:hypothetical protein